MTKERLDKIADTCHIHKVHGTPAPIHLLEEALDEIARLQARIAVLEEENRELESAVNSMVA